MRLKTPGLGITLLVLTTGCSTGSLPDGIWYTVHETFTVSSDPAGAAVYVMGENVGTTPMNLRSSTLFPENYEQDKQSLYGKILLKKDGCSEFLRAVDQKSLSSGFSATLDCAEKPQRPQEIVPTPTPKPSEDAKQRLQRIKDLLDKGLITEEEAQKARARIIDAL